MEKYTKLNETTVLVVQTVELPPKGETLDSAIEQMEKAGAIFHAHQIKVQAFRDLGVKRASEIQIVPPEQPE